MRIGKCEWEYESATHDAIRHFFFFSRWAKNEIEIKWLRGEKKIDKKLQQHNILRQVELDKLHSQIQQFWSKIIAWHIICRCKIGWMLSILKLKTGLHRKINVKHFRTKSPINRFGSIILQLGRRLRFNVQIVANNNWSTLLSNNWTGNNQRNFLSRTDYLTSQMSDEMLMPYSIISALWTERHRELTEIKLHLSYFSSLLSFHFFFFSNFIHFTQCKLRTSFLFHGIIPFWYRFEFWKVIKWDYFKPNSMWIFIYLLKK